MKILCSKIKTTIKFLSLSLIAMILAGIIFVTSSGSLYFGYCYRLVPIYSVETEEKKVALTFDAAWGSDKTLKIVDILKSNGLCGTFFLVGFWIDQNEEKVKQIADAGFDIGTHSNTHPRMTTLSKTKLNEEFETSISKITKITNKPVKYFRAPFGDYNDVVLNMASTFGLKTIQWDVDTLDWKGLSGNEIFNRVKSSVKNGSIILCHNNSDHILDALPLIISYLKDEGFQIVKLSELVYEKNYMVDNNGLQKIK